MNVRSVSYVPMSINRSIAIHHLRAMIAQQPTAHSIDGNAPYNKRNIVFNIMCTLLTFILSER